VEFIRDSLVELDGKGCARWPWHGVEPGAWA
jgi:hypothetical protein